MNSAGKQSLLRREDGEAGPGRTYPGSQSMPTSRPLRSPSPAPGVLVGFPDCGPGHRLPPRAASDSAGRPGAAPGRRGRRPAVPAELWPPNSCSTRTRGRRLPPRPGPRLPVPAARLLLAGAAPARTEVPSRVPGAPRLRPLLLVLRLLHVLGLLDGDADLHRGLGPWQSLLAGLGHGSRAGRDCGAAGSPRREAEPAGRRLMRRGAGAARALGPGKDGGRGAPPRAAATTPCARAGGAAQGEGPLCCLPAGGCPGPIPRPPILTVRARGLRGPSPRGRAGAPSSRPLLSRLPGGGERRGTSDFTVCG